MKTGKFKQPEIWLQWLLILAAIWHLTAPALAAPVRIDSVEGPVNLGKFPWKFHLGDDPTWAQPAVNDADWLVVDPTKANEDSPATRFIGYAWYRIEIRLPLNQGTEKPTQVGILYGGSIFDGQEIYANGVKLGQAGISTPGEIGKMPLMQAVLVPVQAIGSDGTVVLAIRYFQDANYVHVFGKGGGLQPQVRVGNLEVLQGIARKGLLERQVSQLDSVLFTGIFFLVGVYHLFLFSRRRQLKEYFWFGLVALAQSVNAACSTFLFQYWIGIGPMHRISPIAVHLELIFAFEFLWPFLSRKIGPVVRGVQVLQVVLLLVCLLAPFRVFYFPLWQQWHFPLMVVPPLLMYLGLTIWKAWQGNPEARTIVTGVGGFVLMEVFEVGASIFSWPQWNAGQWGLLLFLISMAASLANRFARTYKELDTLNQELEQKVIDRTKELDGKNVELADNLKQLELAKSETEGKNQELDRKNLELDRKISELNRKNEELIASQQRADRIFSALAEALPGTVLEGKYRLEDKIGSGGFGAVFRATHLALGTQVAVKVFRPTPGNDSADAVERFRREGTSTARINHPNALRVLDSGISDEGIAYLVMELLEGYSLWEELQKRGYLSLRRTAEILTPVCQALAEAHRLGIVHRDIKPANIFLHRTGEGEVVKVVDFGIAK
ncbi:MAG: protein kinase, partial [Blastocatellia bacterium]|nr:protein kinase [Blastocatellia bacterium]